MSDQVTISTFLELRDNMSEGLRRLADALEGVTKGTAPATAAVNKMAQQAEEASKRIRRAKTDEEKTAARSAKERERIEARAARYMRLAAERSARERARLEAQATKAMEMAAERRARIAHAAAVREANAAIREAERAMRAKERIEKKSTTPAVSGAQTVQPAFEKVRSIANTLASPIFTAVSTLGGFAALGTAIKIGQEFEDVSIRIAGTLKAFDLSPTFEIAKKQASSVMGTIEQLAAALPGEVDDYITVFAQALPKSISAGMTDIRKVADFTSRYTAVAIANTVDAQQAGMDLFRMLAGQAGADVRMWTVLAEKIGLDAKEFNKLAASVRQSKIDTAIKAFDDQLKAAGDTFSAKFGEMQSRLKEIVRLGTARLFVGVKDVLSDINKYLTKNKTQLISTVKVIARDFLDIIKRLPSIVRELGDRLSEIWDYSKLIVGIWAGAQLLNGLAGALALYKQIKDVVIAINTANVVATAAPLAAPTAQTAARSIGFGSLGVLAAGLGTLLYPKAASASEVDWEKKRREEITSQIELQEKYASIITAISEKMAGVPAAMADPNVAMRDLYKEFTQKLTSPLNQIAKIEAAAQRNLLVDYAQLQGMDINELIADTVKAPKEKPAEKPKHQVNFYNNKFDIKQEFAEGFDPDRIAVAFSNDLGRLGEMKLQSVYGHVGMVR